MSMDPPPSPSRPKSFEGPGSRSLLGEPGPSSRPISIPTSNAHTQPQPQAQPASSSRPTTAASTSPVKRLGGKTNVVSACAPCKRAHLACDSARPCRRCSTMGKVDQCEDVPHKKRGRPKVSRGAGEPYSRGRPSTAGSSTESTISRWRSSIQDTGGGLDPGQPPLPLPSSLPPLYPGQSQSNTSPTYPIPPLSASRPLSNEEPRNVFTLFTTIDLRIIRASPASTTLTGYHLSEFVNRNLLDFISPPDRQLFTTEHSRLLSFSRLSIPLTTSRDTQNVVYHLSHRSAESIAEGMADVYPNTNLHVSHSDRSWGTYNARLHFGGGCGGSLLRIESADRAYLVISFLRIPEDTNTNTNTTTTTRKIHPPPITPISSGSNYNPELPSFASLTSTVPLGQPYYPTRPSSQPFIQDYSYPQPQPPRSSHSTFAFDRPMTSQYSRPVTATMDFDQGGRSRDGYDVVRDEGVSAGGGLGAFRIFGEEDREGRDRRGDEQSRH